MNYILVNVGKWELYYKLNNSSLAASWVNHWYRVSPVTNTHRKFGPQRWEKGERHVSMTTWIDQPQHIEPTAIHSYQWRYFQEPWSSGDMVMGWHSSLPELRQLHALRDVDSVKKSALSVVNSITPEIRIHFGDNPQKAQSEDYPRRVLWWLYENQLLDHVPHMGFELLCHQDPIIAKLVYPDSYHVRNIFMSGQHEITQIRIQPPACF